MKKLTKFFFVLIGIIALLIVMSTLLISVLINPNDFKSIITQQVYQSTGKTLCLTQKIHWTFFPLFGFETKQASLKNKKPFNQKPFATIGQIQIGIKIFPLLYGKIEANQLNLRKLNITIIKNKQGINNLGKQLALALPIQTHPHQKEKHIAIFSYHPMPIHFSTPSLHIKEGNITWNNLKTHQIIKLSNLNLDISYTPRYHTFPFKLSFNVHHNKTHIRGHFTTTGILKIQTEQLYKIHAFQLSANLYGQNIPHQHLQLALKSNLSLTPFSLQTQNLQCTLNQMKVSGSISANYYTILHKIIFKLSMPTLDLDQWLSRDFSILNKKPGTPFLHYWLAHTNIKGQLSIQHLIAKQTTWDTFISLASLGILHSGSPTPMQLNAKNIQTTISINKNLIQYAPTVADIYDGQLNGNFTLSLKHHAPKIKVLARFQQVQLQQLFHSLFNTQNLAGKGNVLINVLTTGNNTQTQLKNLVGSTQFAITNFTIQPLNLAHFLPKDMQSNKLFDTASGTIELKNGIVSNDDLSAKNAAIHMKGAGHLNFLTKKIDYMLKVETINKKTLKPSFMAPIEITGNIQHPIINTNPQKILQHFFKQQKSKWLRHIIPSNIFTK